MKNHTTIFVGLDVHKDSTAVAGGEEAARLELLQARPFRGHLAMYGLVAHARGIMAISGGGRVGSTSPVTILKL